MTHSAVNKLVVLILAAFVTALFALMIKGFLMTLLLAGVFSSLSQPIYRRLHGFVRGRESIAAGLTLLAILLIVIIPISIILSIVVVQAVQVGQAVGPWIQEMISQPDRLLSTLEKLPFYDYLVQYQDQILVKLGDLVSSLSSLLVNSISQVTSSTVQAGFLFFIFLYAFFFFLKDGGKLINIILYYLPLEDEPERKLLDYFTSVTRATLKGTFLIGIIQGTMAALGFWFAGIDSVVFWGLIMTILSIIPLIGSSLVWIPAVIILAVSGRIAAAVALGIYCAVLVGSIDNILRPVLVGKDTKMHELFILLGTLGGIGLFGIWGVLIGPVIAALFISIWELYGQTFAEYLPPVTEALSVVGGGDVEKGEEDEPEDEENDTIDDADTSDGET
ncbi:AI-2E family transporter [Spirochaeta isovalerica]|uniref:Putative PurR-regulated permease PerM n=1 Tax=Spirochaeta isovalerica TaxID=150 RepID=A0A841R4P0_9SPIO|nr:AI-2E family transporter [Spirochaeta isovalerica]MBB6480104.1 putative PurR-regulated permease PerM [Spirochaeta isovalerica]